MATRVEDTERPPLQTSGDWLSTSDPKASGGSFISAFIDDSTLTLPFQGSSISVVGVIPAIADSLNAEPVSVYSIDGVQKGQFNGVMQSDAQYGVTFFSANDLSPGQHTLVMTAQVPPGSLALVSFDYALIGTSVTILSKITPIRSSTQASPTQPPSSTSAITTSSTTSSSPTSSSSLSSSPTSTNASSLSSGPVSAPTKTKKNDGSEPTLGGDPAGATGSFGAGSLDGLVNGGRRSMPVTALAGAVAGAIILLVILLLLFWLRKRKRRVIVPPSKTRPRQSLREVPPLTGAVGSRLRPVPGANTSAEIDTTSAETSPMTLSTSIQSSNMLPHPSPQSSQSPESSETQDSEKRPLPSVPNEGPPAPQAPTRSYASTSWYTRSSMYPEDREAPPAYEAEPSTHAQISENMLAVALDRLTASRQT